MQTDWKLKKIWLRKLLPKFKPKEKSKGLTAH